MRDLNGFSDPLELPNIPEGPGVAVIQDERGQVLQVVMSNNIRRRIGELFDSQGTMCPYGPRIYDAQQRQQRIYVRWKLTQDYREEKRRLIEELISWWA
jgi:excinuclease UvrABC nuclease subunit